MRPIKEIFVEEYWDAMYRNVDSPKDGVLSRSKKPFKALGADKRFWYADTFLFEENGKIFLFVECFDNKDEKGHIAYSEYINGEFTKPKIIISEPYHMSYPIVFRHDGAIYMMPETHQDNCIQLYRAESFPDKWVKDRVIVDGVDCVDSVICGDYIITGEICPELDMSINMNLYLFETGQPLKMNPKIKKSFSDRGAGAIFKIDGDLYRPVQDCTGSVYGQKILFKKINAISDSEFSDEEVFSFTPPDIVLENGHKPCGTHTYSFLNGIEVVDVKLKRFNFSRLLWIIKKKFGSKIN